LDIGAENAGSGPRDGQFSQGSAGPGLREAYALWALFGLIALIVIVTYSRIQPDELYHVSRSGFGGGLSRVLVLLNFPTALMAIAVLALVAERRRLGWWALIPLALSAVIVVPGVVDEGDLDARWINVVPAIGVAIVLVLTLRTPVGVQGDARGDRLRIAVAVVLGLFALPWLFAEVGFYIPGHVFLAEQHYQGHASVHLGEHHGFEGYVLVLTALLLSRQLPNMRHPNALAAYLSLMIPYGIGNMLNDGWNEQIVKRGWTTWKIPSVLQPGLTWMWGLVIVAGAAIFFTAFQQRRDHAATHRVTTET
jgi:hypothetical protein